MRAVTELRCWGRAKWTGLRRSLCPACSDPACRRGRWKAPWRQSGFRLHGTWYCAPECLELALAAHYRRLGRRSKKEDIPAHRVPLGLILLAKGWLTSAQLRAALQAQQIAGHGRIGEWLVETGVTSEDKVTAALAQQWGCPVYPMDSCSELRWADMIPLALLEAFRIVPVYYVASTRALHIAFCDGVDHSILYRLEQMLDCRTEPCLLASSVMQRLLERVRERNRSNEITFERVSDAAEMARITRSYVINLSAADTRIIDCGEQVWVRLRCAPENMNLVFQPGIASYMNRLLPGGPRVGADSP